MFFCKIEKLQMYLLSPLSEIDAYVSFDGDASLVLLLLLNCSLLSLSRYFWGLDCPESSSRPDLLNSPSMFQEQHGTEYFSFSI